MPMRRIVASSFYDRQRRSYLDEFEGDLIAAGPGQARRVGDPFLGLSNFAGGIRFREGFRENPMGVEDSFQLIDPMGVVVAGLLRSFVAEEVLREGDVLVAGRRDGEALRPVRTFTALIALLTEARRDEVVVFRLIRGGRVLEVPVRLDGRVPTGIVWDRYLSLAETDAEAFWQERVVPAMAGDEVRLGSGASGG
jgi:hypothetical protein